MNKKCIVGFKIALIILWTLINRYTNKIHNSPCFIIFDVLLLWHCSNLWLNCTVYTEVLFYKHFPTIQAYFILSGLAYYILKVLMVHQINLTRRPKLRQFANCRSLITE